MNNTFVLSLLLSRANCIGSTQTAQSRFVDGAIGRTHTFEWFSGFKLGKLWFKIVSVQVVSPQVTQMKMCIKLGKQSVKTNEVPF
jgi:hypothetical protein